jgi:geranylgeranyl diphosphate synthase, type II
VNIPQLLASRSKVINQGLRRYLPPKSIYPIHLGKAIHYAVFSGGKRVRPFLVLESARLFGANLTQAMPLACAIEMIHTYSLIHDDLPAMDDDDFRRGKPTCHRKFDEATAILAGDALLSHAFTVISNSGLPTNRIARATRIVSRAIGPYGMVAGQAADLKFNNKKNGLKAITKVNAYKTAALIQVSVEAGAVWGGASEQDVKRLGRFGKSIGFLFQVVDDIIDRQGYASVAGTKRSYQEASRLRDLAQSQMKGLARRSNTKVLNEFSDFLYSRKK